MDTIVIIPARKNSKRIPGKNLKNLNGKPLIDYTIEHALSIFSPEDIIVSSDWEELCVHSSSFNVKVDYRDPNLALDSTKTIDVIKNLLTTEKITTKTYLNVLCLQPTTPLRKIIKTKEALEKISNTDVDSVCSYVEVDYWHPNRMKKVVNEMVVPYCEKEIENVSRKELPKAYYRDGSIYLSKIDKLLKNNSFFGQNQKAVINDRCQFINIDEPMDWILAESVLKQCN